MPPGPEGTEMKRLDEGRGYESGEKDDRGGGRRNKKRGKKEKGEMQEGVGEKRTKKKKRGRKGKAKVASDVVELGDV